MFVINDTSTLVFKDKPPLANCFQARATRNINPCCKDSFITMVLGDCRKQFLANTAKVIPWILKIPHDPKYPKPWERSYYAILRSCRITLASTVVIGWVSFWDGGGVQMGQAAFVEVFG